MASGNQGWNDSVGWQSRQLCQWSSWSGVVLSLIGCWTDGVLEGGDIWFDTITVDCHFLFVVVEFELNIVRSDESQDPVWATPFLGHFLILVEEEVFIQND